jgi:hypothetical protein
MAIRHWFSDDNIFNFGGSFGGDFGGSFGGGHHGNLVPAGH